MGNSRDEQGVNNWPFARKHRAKKAGQNDKKDVLKLTDRPYETSPVFVRGLSRSGGTLLTTILDAHPVLAMSYELYPNLLASRRGDPFNIESVYTSFKERQARGTNRGISGWLQQFSSRYLQKFGLRHGLSDISVLLADPNFKNFYFRLQRGGLTNDQFIHLMEQHIADGDSWINADGRVRFISRCAELKMLQQGKTRWGIKINNHFGEYHTEWPNAFFLMILRDGRDVLVSQTKKGAFNKSPEEVAKGWVSTIRMFDEFAHKENAKCRIVRYENLTRNSKEEVVSICEFLELPFDESMLKFYEQSLTIYKASHLSMDRITKPIDDKQVGKWKTELTSQQLNSFLAVAGDELIRWGYL